MAVTIKEIARRTGLSHPTVSKVLNNREGFSEETRDRVLAAARELGYRPNGQARAMREGRFGNVTLLMSSESTRSTLFGGLLAGLEEGVGDKGMQLSLARLPDETLEGPDAMPRVLREWSSDGLIINYTHQIPPRMLAAIREHAIPSIWLNSKQNTDCVRPDDFEAGERATRHLISLGHRRIAFADYTYGRTPADGHYSVNDRFEGYAEAMQSAGLAVQRLCDIDRMGTPGADRIGYSRSWLASTAAPTAVIAYAPTTAVPILMACQSLGISVPGELSLITFADHPVEEAGVDITTMLLPERQMGLVAIEELLSKIAEPLVTRPARAVQMELVAGGTCGLAPES